MNGSDAVILAVRHKQYLDLDPAEVVKMAGGPIAVVDCFGILDDDRIEQYFKLGCEVKGLGRGHINRIKDKVRKGMNCRMHGFNVFTEYWRRDGNTPLTGAVSRDRNGLNLIM